MKISNIVSLVLIIVLFIVTGYYMGEVSSARWMSWMSYDYDSYNSFGSNYYGPSPGGLTEQAAGIMLLFILAFTYIFIGNLVKVKTTTSKVMCIIGLSFTLIALLFNLLVLIESSSLTFDESGIFFFVYGVICLAFFIVLLVQSVKYDGKSRVSSEKANNTVLDIEIE